MGQAAQMLTKEDLETLAATRLDDATVLLEADRPSAAYYVAGYAVELALKACIAKSFHPNSIPDKAFVNAIYTHDLVRLLGIAGLSLQFKEDSTADPLLAAAWGIASKWTEASRYELQGTFSASSLIGAIRHPEHGVLQWLKKHW